MSKFERYSCDVCQKTTDDDCEIYGFHWQNGKIHMGLKEGLNRHICRFCVIAISEAFKGKLP